MPEELNNLVCELIKGKFGNDVYVMVNYLSNTKFSTLATIVKNVCLRSDQNENKHKIRDVLCDLLQCRFVKIAKSSCTQNMFYDLDVNRILCLHRYSRYSASIRLIFDGKAEDIVNTLAFYGCLRASDVILALTKDEDKSKRHEKIKSYLETFTILVSQEYLIRCNFYQSDAEFLVDSNCFEMIKIDTKKLLNELQEDDEHIFWDLNINKFEKDFRDSIISKYFAQNYEKNFIEIFELFLKLCEKCSKSWQKIAHPVSAKVLQNEAEIREIIPGVQFDVKEYLQCLKNKSGKLIEQFSDRLGDTFTLNMSEVFKNLAYVVIEEYLMRIHGKNFARVFRMVKRDVTIEPEKVLECAMLNRDETNRILCILLDKCFLSVRTFKKPNAYGFVTLLHIKLDFVVRNMIGIFYKILFNLSAKKNSETQVLNALNDQYLNNADVEKSELIQNEVNKVDTAIIKLNYSILETDRKLFILQCFLKYGNN